MYTQNTGFHLVDNSPWPLLVSTALFALASAFVTFMHGSSVNSVIIALVFLIVTVTCWLRDVVREATYLGDHTAVVQNGLNVAVILFIVSEVMFFFGFFWSYFWSAFGATVQVGSVWLPVGIEVLPAYEIPLLNTCILLTSALSLTWSHNALVVGHSKSAIEGLVITIALAFIFTGFQIYEYLHSSLKISDSVYGSTFYMLTGFHGFHVIVGTVMLAVTLVKLMNYQQTKDHNIAFESSAWYWHFVDVVWLFLFVGVYMW